LTRQYRSVALGLLFDPNLRVNSFTFVRLNLVIWNKLALISLFGFLFWLSKQILIYDNFGVIVSCFKVKSSVLCRFFFLGV